MKTKELNERSENLFKEIEKAIKNPKLQLNKKAIKLLDQLIRAVPYLERLRQPELKLALAEIVKTALFVQNGNEHHVTIAEKTQSEIERRLKIYKNIFKSIYYSRSPFGYVLTGLSMILLLLIGICLLVVYGLKIPLNNMTIYGVIGAGVLGGIVSILMRIREFAAVNQWGDPKSSPAVLFFTGFFKPFIGMAFAVFVYAVLNTGIIQINSLIIESNNSFWFYFAVAFLAGFSERFAPDLAEKIGKTIANDVNNKTKESDDNVQNKSVD